MAAAEASLRDVEPGTKVTVVLVARSAHMMAIAQRRYAEPDAAHGELGAQLAALSIAACLADEPT
ncbi:MAG: hypothetical protein S0880_23420 [Actinomycetota bacterium]|nr:hypothetical protein [Actinomycetota bacterium]